MTIRQELALAHPMTGNEAHPDPSLTAQQWISSEICVRTVITVNLSKPPTWHVSLSVQHREAGALDPTRWEKPLRRLVRDIGTEIIKGVGMPADGDRWDVGEKAVHVFRDLRDDELRLLAGVL